STKPSVDKALQTIKSLIIGDNAKVEDRLLELLGKPYVETCLNEEESEEVHLEHACIEKEKVKIVYVINGEEMETLDLNHSK
ncbi:hypothetical protein KI387_008129, partial [Taxus chinensis]